MTKDEAEQIIRQTYQWNGPVRFEVELEDVFVFSAERGWDLVVVNKETQKPFWEDELSEEDLNSIYRRRYKALRQKKPAFHG